MALFNCNFHSDALGRACSMNVIVPQKVQSQIGMGSASGRRNYPVLYLLHGLSDDHSIWERRSSIERHVAELPLVVVMPCVDRSFYTNMVYGYRYWDFISEELPRLVKSFFPVAEGRENTFAAGLSMGGYGAFKLALSKPEQYSFAASLSGVADVADFAENRAMEREAAMIFGDISKVRGGENDLFFLADRCASSGHPLPQLLQICGTEDGLIEANRRFRDRIEAIGRYDYSYAEAPGAHTWEFWDTHIRRVVSELPLR